MLKIQNKFYTRRLHDEAPIHPQKYVQNLKINLTFKDDIMT